MGPNSFVLVREKQRRRLLSERPSNQNNDVVPDPTPMQSRDHEYARKVQYTPEVCDPETSAPSSLYSETWVSSGSSCIYELVRTGQIKAK